MNEKRYFKKEEVNHLEPDLAKKILGSYELPNKVLETIDKPLLTVRTSTYQHVAFIKDCIEGVLAQKTNFPFEFIIGEDYSTDGTREIVFDYAERYPDKIRVITADYNVGMRGNGTRCVLASRGKYMALCEGDDYWIDPFKLQKQMDLLMANPQYSFCYHTYYALKDGEITGIEPVKPKDEITFFDAIWRRHNKVSTTIYKSEIYNSLLFMDRPEGVAGDNLLGIVLTKDGQKGKLINEPMAVYRYHAGGIFSAQADYKKYMWGIRHNLGLMKISFIPLKGKLICMANIAKFSFKIMLLKLGLPSRMKWKIWKNQ